MHLELKRVRTASGEIQSLKSFASPINKKMYDPSCKFYLPLAKTAELPVLRKNTIIRNYEAAEKQYLDDKSEENRNELIAHNSGLRALEYEISFVVNELAICNRCAQAQKQLESVLAAMRESTEKVSDKISEKEAAKKNHLEDKYKDIVNNLFDGPSSVMERAIKSSQTGMDSDDKELIAKAIDSICKEVDKHWREIKKNPETAIKRIVIDNEFVIKIRDKRNTSAELHSKRKFDDFKEKCIKAIYQDEKLSDEEKKMLGKCMEGWSFVPLDASLIDIDKDAIRTTFLYFFKKFDKRQCCSAVESNLTKVLGDQWKRVKNSVEDSIEKSCKRTKELFLSDEKIKKVNPKLKALSREIDALKLQKEDYARFQEDVNGRLNAVSVLTQLQQKGTV